MRSESMVALSSVGDGTHGDLHALACFNELSISYASTYVNALGRLEA